jgi:MOSC domain-containing protein YiiM
VLTVAELTSRFPHPGRIEAILLRPTRREEPVRVEAATLTERGLDGDHASGGLRAVTLIQAEHLPVISALSGADATPERLRRNVVVSGLNLSALKGWRLRLGPEAEVVVTGPCAPCSRMEEALGLGGYNAMRGHGGWCAKVLRPGLISAGDEVVAMGSSVG